ncbi:calmodulin-binding protein 60 B-like isoform X2 [Macadamia integrifolia]|nr:calmodulin-binding protein 60 B-like isoform X2 [Macadamia integrifolia]
MKGLFTSKMEPFLRKVIQEEVERGILLYIKSSPSPSVGRIEVSGSRCWELHLNGRLPGTLFTDCRIGGENGTPIQIVIRDASSKSFITSGPLSSVKVEITILDGDFGTDENEDWTAEEFHASIVPKREGKRPLLTGNQVVTLRNGVCDLVDIAVTDNSRWRRSRKFRLGARVIGSLSSEERIREARSEAFIVKDHRGESNKKHYPPSLGDEVWRLEKIAKDGAFHKRLASREITTVQDFLRHLITAQSSLRSILGNRNQDKTWKTIVDHAKTCILDNKLYVYDNVETHVGLMFNSIYEVVGVKFDGHNYQPLDELAASQRIIVERLKQIAYRNKEDIIEFGGPLNDGNFRQLPSPQAASLQGSSEGMQCPDIPFILQEQLPMQPGFNHLTNTAASVMEDHVELEELSFTQGLHSVQVCTPTQRNSFNMRDFGIEPYVRDGSEWGPSGPLVSVVSAGNLAGGDMCQLQWQGSFPAETSWGQGSGWFVDSRDEESVGFLSSLPDFSVPKMWWFKIRAAIWGISVWRDVAKRGARPLQFYH